MASYKEMMADALNLRYGVGGFKILQVFVYLQTFISRGKHDESTVRLKQFKRTGLFRNGSLSILTW
jgi:hypothetical protein